jgi:integrase
MLSDGTLRGLKAKATAYKVADRDGMYVTVSPKGTITFRLDYRLNGRRETLTMGRYGAKDGISLLMARERCMEARQGHRRRAVPQPEKQREKRRMSEAKTFEQFTNRWFEEARMAESTKSMRKSIIDRDILPAFRSRLADRDRPRRSAQPVRKGQGARRAGHGGACPRHRQAGVFSFAALHGDKAPNPADEVGPSSIATFVPKDRALSPSEIRVMHRVLDTTATLPTIRLALRLILLTLVRKSELIEATWNEIDFENAVWTIPKSRMKAGKPHNVYLSQQALDIMVALRTCAGGSRYLLPSRYDADRCMSKATLNRVTQVVVEKAKESGLPLEPFTVHDLRRTGSTILNELGFNSDWIEKCLAHEDGRSSRGVYNKAEYGEQRRHMLQEWADMIDAWVAGESHTPTLLPPMGAMKVVTTAAPI